MFIGMRNNSVKNRFQLKIPILDQENNQLRIAILSHNPIFISMLFFGKCIVVTHNQKVRLNCAYLKSHQAIELCVELGATG